jgi:hypothetical protein
MAKYKDLTEVYGDGYKLEPEYSDKPFKPDMGAGASEYVGPNASKAGAGRGKQGGPTAKELADYERKQNAGIFMAGMKPPQDVDGGSAAPKKKVVKKAGGGMTASSRGDGIAQRGKTRGKMC